MAQYSSELNSVIKQLRKINSNTCKENEQLAFYEKEVCGTLLGIEGQTEQFILIKVYTRDTTTGQIVLNHYEDVLGNIISGSVVEACCDHAVCGPPYICNANIANLSIDGAGNVVIDMTGTTMTGYLQLNVGATAMGPLPNPGVTSLPVDILQSFRTDGDVIMLLVGNDDNLSLHCSFSFITLTASNEDVKEDGVNPVWQPFPALTAGLECTGTLTYSMLLDATGNGVTVDAVTGDVTIPVGVYIEENSWVYVKVRCDGVLVAVTGLQLLNAEPEEPIGLMLVWDDIANSPFTTFGDLNTYISGNSGTSNFSGIETFPELHIQVFTGGSNVDLGNNFLRDNPNITTIEDTSGTTVVSQGNGNQQNCEKLEKIEFPAMTTQGSGNQFNNPLLTNLVLSALTTQLNSNQRTNPLLTLIDLPALTAMGDGNQADNLVLTMINTPMLSLMGDANYENSTFVGLTIVVAAAAALEPDIATAQLAGATITLV